MQLVRMPITISWTLFIISTLENGLCISTLLGLYLFIFINAVLNLKIITNNIQIWVGPVSRLLHLLNKILTSTIIFCVIDYKMSILLFVAFPSFANKVLLLFKKEF